MNIHHLELFYYVARHGGISEAVRNMPYGIQQPAISGQIIQLEEYLGVTLFHRRPFELTAEGRELYGYIQPFFENLEPMAEKLRGGVSQHLRIAAAEIVLRDHLPQLLQELRGPFPNLKVTLREAYPAQMIPWLQQREVDVCIGLMSGKPPAGISAMPLLKLPLALLLPKASKLKSSRELWARDKIEETLIALPAGELVTRVFQEGLAKLQVDWFTGIEVSSLELVQTYVANGFGIGLWLHMPKRKIDPRVRLLALEGFEPVTLGTLWQGGRNPLLEAFFKIVAAAARKSMEGEDMNLSP